MADTKIVIGSGLARRGCEDKDKDKHKHGCECFVDHVTIGGSGSKKHPFEVIGIPGSQPFPADAPVLVTIYARTNGSDEKGDGSLEHPYRTFQEAVLHVPLIIGPGVIYRIDITGIDETLPADYELPAWKAPGISGDVPVDNPFTIFQAPIEIFATPQPVATIPLADTIINVSDLLGGTVATGVSIDPLTKLRTVTLQNPRPTWVAGLTIKGKQILDGGDSVNDCVVAEVTASSILITNAVNPTFPIQLVEPSAHLHGSGVNWGTIRANNVDCIGFTGVKITSDNGVFGLLADGSGTCVCQMCELDSPFLAQQSGSVFYSNANRAVRCWIYNFPTFSGVIGIVQSLVQNAAPVSVFDTPFFCAPTMLTLRRAVFDSCDPIEVEVYEPGGNIDGAATPHFLGQNLLVKGGNGDGLIFHGVKGHFVNCDFAGNAGNGLTVNGGGGLLDLHNVGSSVPNTGIGLLIDDGMQVTVDANTIAGGPGLTPLNGATQIQLGTQTPITSTWVAFGALVPTNLTDYAAPGASGARLTNP